MGYNSISICIPTYNRPQTLKKTLQGIEALTTTPREVIVCDASENTMTQEVIKTFSKQPDFPPITYIHSKEKCLPLQRHTAFLKASAQIILFLDDDILLKHNALHHLLNAYNNLTGSAGIGFIYCFEDKREEKRNKKSIKERFLKTNTLASGSRTAGGISVTNQGAPPNSILKVNQLSGGTMSFKKEVLENVGTLNNLYTLYLNGIGRGEDTVLSNYAANFGDLWLITNKLAFHPTEDQTTGKPYATNAFKKGLTYTYGRAHTLKWLAINKKALRQDVIRLLTFEIMRQFVNIVKKPWNKSHWLSYWGTLYGCFLTLFKWKKIPETAKTL